MDNINLDFNLTYITMFRENPENDNCATQYRRELLKFFKLDKYDDTRIGIRTDKLYHELVKHQQFVILFTLISNEPMLAFISDSTEITSACLSMLCSFNYFHLLFKALCEFNQSQNISEDTFTEFRAEISRNLNNE